MRCVSTHQSAGCVFGALSHSKRAAMTALEKKPVTVKDIGLVQGLLVVAAQLKKYGRDGLDTNSACADPRRFNCDVALRQNLI